VEDQGGELATLEWVAWFNNHRLLEPIGYIPPAQAEANSYRHRASQDAEVVASLEPNSLHASRSGSDQSTDASTERARSVPR
jgi:hypothetical protein